MKRFSSSWLTARRRKYYIPLAFGLLITLLFYGANLTKPAAIEQIGNLLFDSYQRASPREYDENIPVRIIDIDNESITKVGQWPWPRTEMAKLNDRLNQAGAGVIAYDILFAEEDRTSPENIVRVLQDNPNVSGDLNAIKSLKSHDQIFAESLSLSQAVAGFFFVRYQTETLPLTRHGFGTGGSDPKERIDSYGGALTPLPVLETAASGAGFLSFDPTGDGIIRRAPLISRIDSRYFPALSIEALRVAQGATSFIIRSTSGTGELAAPDTKDPGMAKLIVGDFEVPTTDRGEIVVYYTKPEPQRFIPAWKILSDDVPISEWAPLIGGHIVFVGTGADGLKDLVSTPIRPREPGVLVHAQVTEQIIGDTFLERPYWAEYIEQGTLLFFGFLLAIILPRLGIRVGALSSLLLASLVIYVSWYAFKEHQLLLNPVYPLFGFIVSYVVITLASFYLTEVERARVRSAFSMYLSPEMVRKVSDDPALLKLGGVEREMTVFFLDIRSFTKICEPMQAEDITTFLNIFLSPMTDILQDNHATIDKYMGDAIVAFWNAPLDDPEHEKNAARACLIILEKLAELNRKYRSQTDIIWPQDKDVAVGIGVNTGVCCVGNLGSEQRFAYSMIGDAANLASRIEGLTKQYRVPILLGQSSKNALGDFALIEADYVKVLGRAAAEPVHILLGDESLAKTPEFRAFATQHAAFLKQYRAREFAAAMSTVKALLSSAEAYACQGYYQTMTERMAGFKSNPPPPDWDGSFIPDSK